MWGGDSGLQGFVPVPNCSFPAFFYLLHVWMSRVSSLIYLRSACEYMCTACAPLEPRHTRAGYNVVVVGLWRGEDWPPPVGRPLDRRSLTK